MRQRARAVARNCTGDRARHRGDCRGRGPRGPRIRERDRAAARRRRLPSRRARSPRRRRREAFLAICFRPCCSDGGRIDAAVESCAAGRAGHRLVRDHERRVRRLRENEEIAGGRCSFHPLHDGAAIRALAAVLARAGGLAVRAAHFALPRGRGDAALALAGPSPPLGRDHRRAAHGAEGGRVAGKDHPARGRHSRGRDRRRPARRMERGCMDHRGGRGRARGAAAAASRPQLPRLHRGDDTAHPRAPRCGRVARAGHSRRSTGRDARGRGAGGRGQCALPRFVSGEAIGGSLFAAFATRGVGCVLKARRGIPQPRALPIPRLD